jgi:farnesyl-diphosphate farnesyltransferase
MAQRDAIPFCHEILGEVSRTFALTIPQLPARLKDEVCVAYLICRVADTIEDHETLDQRTRTRLFNLLRALLANPADGAAWRSFRRLWPGVAHRGEDRLVAHLPIVLTSFRALSARTRTCIRNCVSEMAFGMARYGRRGTASDPQFVCRDLDQLENYCHYVAATVGGLLTRLFHHVFASESGSVRGGAPSPEILERGRRFGLALQMTNVLKDHRRDLDRGLAFLPPDALERDGGEWRISREALRAFLTRVLGHLDEAQRYVLWIPAAHRGVRLFCLWALHLALRTLLLAATPGASPLPKVSRRELAEIIARAEAAVADDAALERLYQEYRRSLAALVQELSAPEALGSRAEPLPSR